MRIGREGSFYGDVLVRRYLFDASVIVNMVKRETLIPLAMGYSLDLTIYEALNAVWKESMVLRRIDFDSASRLARGIIRVLELIGVLSIDGLEEEVYEMAVREGLTVYDSSYLTVAIDRGLTLVTDDVKLGDKASKYVSVASSRELLEGGSKVD